MATNNFKIFDENKRNMQSDTEYSSDSQRLQGVQSGVASSKLNNKFAYQVSLVAYAIAQMMNANGINANDTDAVSTFVNNLSASVVQKVVDKATTAQAQAGTDNTKWVTPAHIKAAIQYYTNGSGSNITNVRHGGTGLNSVPANNFLVGSGYATSMYSRTPTQVKSLLGVDKIQQQVYPIGTMINSVDPDFPSKMDGEWLPCDGRVINKDEYSELWELTKNSPANSIVPFTNINGYSEDWYLSITGGKKINGFYYLIGTCKNFLGSSSVSDLPYPVVIYHESDSDLSDEWSIVALDIPPYTTLQSSCSPLFEVNDICYNDNLGKFFIVGALPEYDSGRACYSTMAYWYGDTIETMERKSDQDRYLNAYTNYISSCVAVDDYFVASYIYYSNTFIYKIAFDSSGSESMTNIFNYSSSLGFINLFYSNDYLYFFYKDGYNYHVRCIKKSDFTSSATGRVKDNYISDNSYACVVNCDGEKISVIASKSIGTSYVDDGFSNLYSFMYKDSSDGYLRKVIRDYDIGILNDFYGLNSYNRSQDYILFNTGIYSASDNPVYIGRVNVEEKTFYYISEHLGSNYSYSMMFRVFSDFILVNSSSSNIEGGEPVFLSLLKALPIKQNTYIKAKN